MPNFSAVARSKPSAWVCMLFFTTCFACWILTILIFKVQKTAGCRRQFKLKWDRLKAQFLNLQTAKQFVIELEVMNFKFINLAQKLQAKPLIKFMMNLIFFKIKRDVPLEIGLCS